MKKAVGNFPTALFLLFARRQSEDMSVLAQDYPSTSTNPSSLAKRDARGLTQWMNDLLRTLLCTLAATLAFLCINHCDIILHLNSFKLTLFYTEAAANTSGLADTHDILALIL